MNTFINILQATVGVIAVGAFVTACYFYASLRSERRRADTAEKAYSELTAQSALRERELISELNSAKVRAKLASGDAERLAKIVATYIQEVEEMATLLKDEKPPAMVAEREALRLHTESVAHRIV